MEIELNTVLILRGEKEYLTELRNSFMVIYSGQVGNILTSADMWSLKLTAKNSHERQQLEGVLTLARGLGIANDK